MIRPCFSNNWFLPIRAKGKLNGRFGYVEEVEDGKNLRECLGRAPKRKGKWKRDIDRDHDCGMPMG